VTTIKGSQEPHFFARIFADFAKYPSEGRFPTEHGL